MSFAEFLGNPRIVTALRGMLTNDRVPNAMLFTGPRGVGKYTLARMFSQAANCERLRDDFCGECEPCRKIGLLADPAPLIQQGLAERGESADSSVVERVPLILQTHPDVWAIVPDPVRLKTPVARPVIHVGQLRAVQRAAYFRPQGRRRVFILDGAETMRWDLANIFLKILEEPPESATLILLAPSPYALLPTIVSRCFQFYFAPLAAAQIEAALERKTQLTPKARQLAAQMSEGSLGLALGMDVDRNLEVRREALRLLELAVAGKSSLLFAQTGALAKKQDIPFETVPEMLSSLLNDLFELTTSPADAVLRNLALQKELRALSEKVNSEWVRRAVAGVDLLYSRMRRNINRQLSLDALGVSLAAK